MGKSKQGKIRILDREENLGSTESIQGEASRGTSSAAGACKKQTACGVRRNINKACKRCEAPSNEGSEDEKTSQIQEKEVVELGLDISTAVIGIALVTLDGSCQLLDHIKFSTKQETLWDKAAVAATYLARLKQKYFVRRIFVEASAMSFTPGFSSAQTLFTLAKFNGIVSYIAKNTFGEAQLHDINVNTARKALAIKIDRKDKSRTTKDKVFDAVRKSYPNLQWLTHVAKTGKSKGAVVFDKENYDRADAFIICKGGQLTTTWSTSPVVSKKPKKKKPSKG